MIMDLKIIWRLVVKIVNFADIRRNNSVFLQKKEMQIFKLSVARNQEFYRFFNKLVAHLLENHTFKINQPREKFNNSNN